VINISLPKGTESWYITSYGYLLGPYSPNGLPMDMDVISYRHESDSLNQGSERYHEKDVNHTKIAGDLTYHQPASEMVLSATSEYPNYSTWACYDVQNRSNANIAIPRGLIKFGEHSYRKDGLYTHYNMVVVGSLDSHTYYSVKADSRYKTQVWVDCIRRVNRPPSYSLSTGYVEFTSWRKEFNLTNFDATAWFKSNPGVAALGATLNVSTVTPGTERPKAYRSRTQKSLSISSLKLAVNSLVDRSLKGVESPLPSKDFGDLAMEASQKVNAINANMIAFLRDLRRPQDMIPKLKNLESLKGISGNYLSVQYGLLPTISDIKEILGAFKKVAPYVDRNGYQTYSAVHSESSSSSSYFYERTQRIKIAIENEDSAMQDLANKIESAGFSLTLQNVWDLIPYSFVLDWFIDVGSMLERADTRMRIMRLNIRYATMSVKDTIGIQVNPKNITASVTGTVQVVHYHRWTDDHCPVPPLSLAKTPTPFNHWLEAGALLMQRTK